MFPKQETNKNNDESSFNYRVFVDIVILHWQWFVVSIFLCSALAFLYVRYTAPVYNSWIDVLIKEDDPYSSRVRGNSLADFSQLGFMTNSNGFDNEISILGSRTLSRRVVTNLKLHVLYAYKGRIRDRELYKNSPIIAEMSYADLDTLSTVVRLSIKQNAEGKLNIEGSAGDEEFYATVNSLPARIKTTSGWVALRSNPNPTYQLENNTLKISIVRPKIYADAYLGSISIEPTSKLTTIARIVKAETISQRARDFLNELVRVYNESANEVKNEVALKTEAFVNKRIAIIDAELGTTESILESFKKNNRLVDLTSDAEVAYRGSENYQSKQIELQTQILLVKSLREYIEDPSNYMEVIPSNLGLTDASLNRIISEYNSKIVERKRLLASAPESSPVVQATTNAIVSLYPGIKYSLLTVYENLKVQKRNIDDQYDAFIARLGQAPTQERVLADIGRQQSVKAALYQILLQKREENAISLASTVDKAQVVDPADSGFLPVSPRKKIIFLIALFLGVVIPVILFYLLQGMRYRIGGRSDVEKLTDIPILTDIFVSKKLAGGKRAVVVRENANGIMEETFRNLRTNLDFVMSSDEKVLLVTSMIAGEGKTFVSSNLAMSEALAGHKVLLVGLDIRKPRLAKLFNIQTGHNGVTTFLVSEDASEKSLKEQIFPSGLHANLDVLPAGVIPPNPGELIGSKRLDDAFAFVRDLYDVVIVDTPPLGLVSDSLLLGRLADATLIVCRCDFSWKHNFDIINSYKNDKKFPKISLVLNGIDLDKPKYGYYYGYGNYGRYAAYGNYGRYGGYGNYGGYDEEKDKRKGLFGRLSRKSRS